MLGYYLNVGILYFFIGFAAALIYSFIFKKKTIGGFWSALLVGVLGSFLGAVVEYFFKDGIYFLSHINDTINIFPPIITSFLLLWIFVSISGSNNDDRDL